MTSQPNPPHPWPLPVPTHSLARAQSEARTAALTMSPQTGSALTRESRGSRRPLPEGPQGPPAQVPRRTLIPAEELPPLPSNSLPSSWSPQVRLPISLPSPIQIGNALQTPQGSQPTAIVQMRVPPHLPMQLLRLILQQHPR